MAALAVTTFEEAAGFEHLAQFLQHARAATHHDPVGIDIQRRQIEIVEQLFRGDEVGDAAAVAERLAGDGRIILELSVNSGSNNSSSRNLATSSSP